MCSLPVPREPLRRVAVTGGTHGNEMSGVYLARHWLQAPAELQRLSFSTVPVLANPAATAACRRYVDDDLNRTFTSSFLNSRPTPDDPYEVTRARELNQLLGPKASGQAFDFVLDLHNTTANMGTCLIAKSSHEVFAMHLCHHLQLQYPELSCQVFLYQQSGEESYNLDSLAKNGLALELDPQPQGVTLVATVLDFIELFNQGTAFPAFEMEAYRPVGVVDFPRTDAGNLAGTVHTQLQVGVDFPTLIGKPSFPPPPGHRALISGEPA
uniref:Aminoacylase 3 n=1 Tax=Piliocolobus tephrosceles TaxID=591936 RepID=A0A8C9LWP0_9PRIM